MKVKKRKIKKKVIYIFIALIIVIIGSIAIKNHIDYINSNYYKLNQVGYNDEEIETIEKLSEKQIDIILSKKYDKKIVSFLKQKYFIFDNLDKYLEYTKEFEDRKISDVVALVNVLANEEHYDEEIVKPTDTSKGILMLVNKYNYLTNEYAPDDIEEISNYYSYAGNSIKKEVYDHYKDMWNAAKKEDLSLIVTSSYRSYEIQSNLWESRSESFGDEAADASTARAGYSEHQSGLALDIVTYNVTMNEFINTDEFKWLQKNAYKYGFILRYPENKTEITGYDYESWHYRYVGIEVATKIHELDITFDEYYAYFIK
ncbi:MAG: M15 family metallopeptidase [Bacilli bacterium]|nr:M15 family metallopeptidase [Bacilli bacterium]